MWFLAFVVFVSLKDDFMTESYAIDVLTRRATSYFDRPSFSTPSFLSDTEIAFLDDRSGTKQASVLDLTNKTIKPLTKFTERLLSLKASTASGRGCTASTAVETSVNRFSRSRAMVPNHSA